MTAHDSRNPDRSVTISEAFDKLGDYYTEQHGPGSAEQGWDRLQRALDDDEPADDPAPDQPDRSTISWWKRPLVKYWVAGVLMSAGSLVTFYAGPLVAGVATVAMLVALTIGVAALLETNRRQIAKIEATRLAREHREEIRAQKSRRKAVRKAALARQKAVQDIGRMDSSGIVDLAGADLTETDLTEVNLVGANLAGATLDGKNLRGGNLYGTNLADASLFGAELSRAELSGADLTRADLTTARLIGTRLAGTTLTNAHLTGAILSGAVLAAAHLSGADLAGAVLSGADFNNADLSGAALPSAYITRAYLAGANLEGADLGRANLRGSHLYGANLTRANLAAADLTHTDLRRAILIGADLTDAKLLDLTALEEVTWSEATIWGRYRNDVIKRSTPLGRGCYRLNPAEGTSPGPVLLPRIPVV
ncbi:pentapeptide repeat-containing protein [Nocardia carnea]|uniref:pentapeptide repeat-containing protein n=1 Tax=Nocardia carnea TaxID=37328 RepID=UPI0002EC0329|nr:pentapeptide repeat-containing protein [Nocardia carnea]